MGRTKRFSMSPSVPSFTRNMLPMLVAASLFLASSAAVISCPSDGCSCPLIDIRAAFNMSGQSFATCDAASPPSQIPPMTVQLQPPIAAAAAPAVDQTTKQHEDSTQLRAAEQPIVMAATSAADTPSTAEAVPPPAAAAAAVPEPQPQIATFDEWTKQKLLQPPVVAVPPVASSSAHTGSSNTLPVGSAASTQSGSVPRVPESVAHAPTAATRNYASRECGAKVIYSNPEAENTKAVLNDKEKDDYMRNPCDKAQHKHIVIELCETIQPRSIEIANFELFSSGPASVRFSAAERFPSQQWSVLGEWSLADSRTVQTLPVPADKLTYAKFIKLELLAHHGAEHYCTLSTVRVLGVSMVDEYEAEATVAARLSAPHAVPSAPEAAPVLVASQPPSNEELPVKKEEPVPAAAPTITPTEATPIVAQTTEMPPVAVVEAPPTAAATAADKGEGQGGLVQDVMSGTLLKKIIEVVGGRKKERAEPASRTRESAYATCDRTPAGAPFIGCVRHHFFCPPLYQQTTTVSPAKDAAARRAHARRLLVAATQRREEEAAKAAASPHQTLPPTQIEAPPQRKATTVVPVVLQQQQQPAAAVSKDKESPHPTAAATPAPQHQQQQQAPPPVGIFEGLPAGTSSHKESVFMKLNKRIAALELNMSLSTEYLSELSRQYIAHTDEQKKAMERTRAAAERAAADVARTVNETVRDELFNLRKEVDALSVWLATLRQQAGGVALARRISGAHAADYETSTAPESPASLEVGHTMRSIDMDAEDYVTYEEAYEQQRPTCPYTGRRSRQGRTYGPQPRPVHENESADEEEEEEQADAFDLRHFGHHSDGIWTTEQVLYAVLGAQALTVILVLLMQACYARVFGRRRLQPVQQQPAATATSPLPPQPTIDTMELERLIAVALERRAEREREAAAAPPVDPEAATATDASPRSSASSVTSTSGPAAQQLQQQQSGNKKRRRQRRSTMEQQQATASHHHHQCRQCGERSGGNLDWDSAMDSSLPSPSQTGSEEEFEAPPTSEAAAPSSPPAVQSSPKKR